MANGFFPTEEDLIRPITPRGAIEQVGGVSGQLASPLVPEGIQRGTEGAILGAPRAVGQIPQLPGTPAGLVAPAIGASANLLSGILSPGPRRRQADKGQSLSNTARTQSQLDQNRNVLTARQQDSFSNLVSSFDRVI